MSREIKVIAYDEKGNKIGEDVKRTAGTPTQLILTAEYADNEKAALKADGDDMAFITVSLADKDGNFCPTADDELTFEVTGEGVYQAACNGDATSLEPFTEPQMKLFAGQLVVLVRSTKTAGTMTLKVTDNKRKLEKTIDIRTM